MACETFQWFPRDFASGPSNLDVVTGSLVVLVFGMQGSLMLQEFFVCPYAALCLVPFDVVNNVVVRYDFFVFFVDQAFELDHVRMIPKVFFVVNLDLFDDLGAYASSVLIGRHKERPGDHFFWRQSFVNWSPRTKMIHHKIEHAVSNGHFVWLVAGFHVVR